EYREHETLMTTLTHFLRVSLISVAVAILVGSSSLRAGETSPEGASHSVGAALRPVGEVLRPDGTLAAIESGRKAPPTAPSSDSTPTPFTRDQLMAALTRVIGAHFNFEGELQLDLIRTWTPPARVANVWDLDVTEYPSVPASSMMLRCRVLA